MKKQTRILLSILIAVVLAIGIGSCAYVSDYYHADETAQEAMVSQDEQIKVEQDGNVTWFIPENPEAGFIFYPGGKVEFSAYAPLMKACAKRGIQCALVRMPANLAVLDPNAADGLEALYPQIKDWYIGGHSLGGAMATSYAAGHADKFKGIILLAAYSTKDLANTGLRVLSIYGSKDGVLNREAYEKDRLNLPADTTEIILEGGNHSQFGSYGHQEGDGDATISDTQQIQQTAEAIQAFVSDQTKNE
ncbi:alpha/beta fold hydrolase [Erysipelotrichaceae bacterium 51-3]